MQLPYHNPGGLLGTRALRREKGSAPHGLLGTTRDQPDVEVGDTL